MVGDISSESETPEELVLLGDRGGKSAIRDINRELLTWMRTRTTRRWRG